MAEDLLGKFRCVVLTPKETLLDCTTRSVTLPAHDGQMGVWRNHMPTLCRLGLGIMNVSDVVTDDAQTPGDACFLIDGGFARISGNVITVLAYDVTSRGQIDAGKAEKMLEEANKLPGDDLLAMQRRQHGITKALLLMKLAGASDIQKNEHGRPS